MFNKRFSYSGNDFYMFDKWFSLSANDFYVFNKWFLYSANDFQIQQEIHTSNLKFVFSNMRFIFNNLRFAFNAMKFIKLKSFTFSKPNLDVIKYASNHSLHITEMMLDGKVLFLFTVLLVKELLLWIGIGWGLVTCMWMSTRFLYKYSYGLCIFF